MNSGSNGSLTGKRPRPNESNNSNTSNNDNDSNSNNNGLSSGFALLRTNSNIRRPSAKRPRLAAPSLGPQLVRQNAIVPGAPRKAARPSNLLFAAPPSALKGTAPKNRTRRVSHSQAAPTVLAYELNNNAAPMVHMNSQTYQTFHRYILPCLLGKIPDEEIQRIYDMYVMGRTSYKAVASDSPKINPEVTAYNAESSAVFGALMAELQDVNSVNYRTFPRSLRNLPPGSGVFDWILELFASIRSQYSADPARMKAKMSAVFSILEPYLQPLQRQELSYTIESIRGGRAASKRRTNKRSTRISRKN